MAGTRVGPEQRAVVPLPMLYRKRGRWPRQVFCVALLVSADTLAIALALALSVFLQIKLVTYYGPYVSSDPVPLQHYFRLGLEWLLLLIFLAAEGLYTLRRTLWNEVGHTIRAVLMGSVAISAITAFAPRHLILSRAVMLFTALLLLVLLPVTKAWAKHLLYFAGPWQKRLLILGAGDTAALALAGLCNDTVFGYEPVGLIDDDPSKIGRSMLVGGKQKVRVLGPVNETAAWILASGAHDVLIAMPAFPDDKLLSIISEIQGLCESVLIIPQLWALPMMNLDVDGFFRERVLLLKLRNNLAKPWNMWIKRTCDIVVGAALLLLLLPMLAIIAVLIRTDSSGAAFFSQKRLGFRGTIFHCLKFRTMFTDADQQLERYLRTRPEAREEMEKYAKLREFDPRVTRLGKFLRRWSIDELPQLINVIKGEMSLVGPRPYILQERARIGAHISTIVSARPGMSGLWQVNGRNHLTFEHRVQLDEWYVRHWGMWLDLIVLAKTLRAIFSPAKPVISVAWVDEEVTPRKEAAAVGA